ncbi:MAG: cytidine deaminase [Lachnospiraceae bacterium]|nr:cytidine deaminase [Lachnospiraceae bacterium]
MDSKEKISIDTIYSLLFAEAKKGNCLFRKYSAAIVKNSHVISLGYAQTTNGKNCIKCERFDMIKKYGKISEFFEYCSVVHAEISAILNVKNRDDLVGGDLYLLGIYDDDKVYDKAYPCKNCIKIIKYVGIKNIYVMQSNMQFIKYEVKK